MVVLSSPSGGGKTTVIRNLLNRNPDFRGSVSATTRIPRNGEQDGVDYHFMSRGAFKKKIEENAFYEWARVHGNCYGTLKEPVDAVLRKGGILLLALDVQGGLHIKECLPDSVLVFLLPPSMEVLKHRLGQRGTEHPGVIAQRMRYAPAEIAVADRYDYQLINNRLDDTVYEIEQLIRFFHR